MTSLTELTDIIKILNHKITAHETGLLRNKLKELDTRYSDRPALLPLLKMMRSIEKYLDSKKDNAHPDSIPVLLSIASRFEKIINDLSINLYKDKDEINKIVSGEIQKYKALQSNIISKPPARDSNLDNLKAVILAIDWEISDGTLRHFEKVVTDFLSIYQHNKLYHHFLKIIRSLGQYIGSRKANAHPDAISFLRSVFDDFEKLIQTPAMSYPDRKEILEKNISRFHELKIRISKEKKHPAASITEEEFLPPALSHIKPSSQTSLGNVMPVTLLFEPDEAESKNTTNDDDGIKPALSDRKRPSSAPRDVMGDLFSIKGSAADELLDEIHLMDVHGPNQGRAHMMDQAAHSPSSGIKQFTTELKNNEPIPEIENRLDEFFNLETSSETSTQKTPPDDQTVEFSAEPEEDKTEGIVPFQYEDEPFEPGDTDDEGPEKQGVSDILGRLKTRIETLDRSNPLPVLSSIKNDVSHLKNLWQNDPEKTDLLELLVLSLRFLENPTKGHLPARPTTNHLKNEPIPEYFREKPPGIFARIKSIFTS